MPGHPIIDFHSDSAVQKVKPTETRNDKLECARKKGCVLQYQDAFAQRFLHDLVLMDIEVRHRVLQIAHASVNDFGRGTRRRAGEVSAVQHDGLQATELGIESAPGANRSPSDHAYIERVFLNTFERFLARLHGTLSFSISR